jgi:hypothetical protein
VEEVVLGPVFGPAGLNGAGIVSLGQFVRHRFRAVPAR